MTVPRSTLASSRSRERSPTSRVSCGMKATPLPRRSGTSSRGHAPALEDSGRLCVERRNADDAADRFGWRWRSMRAGWPWPPGYAAPLTWRYRTMQRCRSSRARARPPVPGRSRAAAPESGLSAPALRRVAGGRRDPGSVRRRRADSPPRRRAHRPVTRLVLPVSCRLRGRPAHQTRHCDAGARGSTHTAVAH